MHRLISTVLDESIFEILKLAFRGYRRRLPGYKPPSDCDMGALGAVEAPAHVALEREHSWKGYQVEAFAFASPVECVCEESRLVTGRLLKVEPDAPWALIIPGYCTGALPPFGYGWFQEKQGLALLKRGLNVALLDLPLHMKRKRAGRGSGEGFFSPDLEEMQGAFRQAAADCIALVRWLQGVSGRPVGVWGTSLGGNVAGLMAANVPDLAALVLMEPLDNPGEPVALLRSSREIRQVLEQAGIDPLVLTETLRTVAPSSYQPALPCERMLFFTPMWDRIIPAHFQEAFWQAWGCPERVVVPAGHVTLLADATINNRAADFLARWTVDSRT